MPTRVLRDWTDSEAVNALDATAEVLFVRLIMKADDFGRFTANPRLIRSLCFPIRDGVRESDISRQLAACEKAGLIALYEVETKPFLEIRNYGQRLRAMKSKYPPPESGRQLSDKCQTVVSSPPSDVSHMTARREAESDLETETDTESEAESRKTPTAIVVSKPTGPEFPEQLNVGYFRQSWLEWQAHRKEIKKPMTDRACKMQLKALAEMGPERASAAIYHSIANGWQGIFEKEGPRGGSRQRVSASGGVSRDEDRLNRSLKACEDFAND